MPNPTPLEDGTIVTRINYEGFPFQRAIYNEIRNIQPPHYWDTVKEEVPIHLLNPPDPTISMTIDIMAITRISDRNIYLLIECKRHDPKRKIWLFALDARRKEIEDLETWKIKYHRISDTDTIPRERFESTISIDSDIPNTIFPMEIISDEGGKRSGRKNPDVLKACLQAASGVIGKVEDISSGDSSLYSNSWIESSIFLPLVVTTANLYSFDCTPSPETILEGKISLDDIEIKAQKWLIFNYPLPTYLCKTDEGDIGSIHPDEALIDKLPIIIVNSKNIVELLKKIN